MSSDSVAPTCYRPLQALGRRLACGRLTLVLPGGVRMSFEGAAPGPEAELEVRRTRFVRRLVTGGANGFAEAYVDGDCDTPDLAAFLHLAALNLDHWRESLRGGPLYRTAQRVAHLLRPNSKRGAKRNIAAHYDLGNAFYSQWLDPSMTYSSAVYEPGALDLQTAQRAKYRRIAQAAGIQSGERVLEVGCGWGGFAEYAAGELGAKVTAITISDAQYAFAAQRIQQAGLGERAEIRRQDYRDVTGRFDRVASIEMFEAVGEHYWPQFFGKLRDVLEPGGRAALQVITIADGVFEGYRRSADFIQRHIFPGGMLPSPSALRAETGRAGLSWQEASGYGQHYARTLEEWHGRFDAAWPQLVPLGFDERFRRLWKYYLAYCEAGFRTARLDVLQVALTRA